MEAFVVSARKYRPVDFEDVVGQSFITKTLMRSITQNHLAQALLFCGPRGVGKTTCARILARKINEKDKNLIDSDFSFNIFELDAASNNSVDDIRSLIDQVRIPPQIGRYKVYIIDEAHMLSPAAFNAFLKTLEEPPKHAIFILATTEKQKIIPTILSRCQIFDFKRITVEDITHHLKKISENQNINAQDEALRIIAQKSDGALRDALSIFDRMVSFCGEELTTKAVSENLNVLDYDTYLHISDLILSNDIPSLLLAYDDILARGFDGHHFVSGLATHFRNLIMCLVDSTVHLTEMEETTQIKYQKQCTQISREQLLEYLEITSQCDINYTNTLNQRLLVELCLMQLASVNFNLKKKSSFPIIPAKRFNAPEKKRTPEEASQPNNIAPTENLKSTKEIKPEIVEYSSEKNPLSRNNSKKEISSLSLSSIKRLKDSQNSPAGRKKQLPKNDFSEENLLKAFKEFTKNLEKSGHMSLFSLLEMSNPKLKAPNLFSLDLPSDASKKEVQGRKSELLEFIHKKLNNYTIDLEINLVKDKTKGKLFLPKEKYEKLMSLNPDIELLKEAFQLKYFS